MIAKTILKFEPKILVMQCINCFTNIEVELTQK